MLGSTGTKLLRLYHFWKTWSDNSSNELSEEHLVIPLDYYNIDGG